MKAVVLAAGKGTRLNSEQNDIPKVLRQINGKPILRYVLDNINFIPEQNTIIIVGYKKEMVINYFGSKYKYQIQNEQLGTGHAVMMAKEELKDYDGDILVVYGDMPLFKKETYQNIINLHKESKAECTLLTAVVENPPSYGRIIRNKNKKVINIIEEKDCNENQKSINEINVGVYVFDNKSLFESIKEINTNNAQKEYYLTDIPKVLLKRNKKVNTFTIYDENQIHGVNTEKDLELCEELLFQTTTE